MCPIHNQWETYVIILDDRGFENIRQNTQLFLAHFDQIQKTS
jgi:hypothetical protein